MFCFSLSLSLFVLLTNAASATVLHTLSTTTKHRSQHRQQQQHYHHRRIIIRHDDESSQKAESRVANKPVRPRRARAERRVRGG